MDHLGAVDEVELGERQDAVAVEGRLEGEVEALEGLRRRFYAAVGQRLAGRRWAGGCWPGCSRFRGCAVRWLGSSRRRLRLLRAGSVSVEEPVGDTGFLHELIHWPFSAWPLSVLVDWIRQVETTVPGLSWGRLVVYQALVLYLSPRFLENLD